MQCKNSESAARLPGQVRSVLPVEQDRGARSSAGSIAFPIFGRLLRPSARGTSIFTRKFFVSFRIQFYPRLFVRLVYRRTYAKCLCATARKRKTSMMHCLMDDLNLVIDRKSCSHTIPESVRIVQERTKTSFSSNCVT